MNRHWMTATKVAVTIILSGVFLIVEIAVFKLILPGCFNVVGLSHPMLESPCVEGGYVVGALSLVFPAVLLYWMIKRPRKTK
jgi:hypothetical protein